MSETPLTEDEMGWFHIEDIWNLYVDGTLTEVEVYAIEVDEAAHGDGYVVDHYNRSGSIITTNRLTADDIRPEVSDREPISDPFSF